MSVPSPASPAGTTPVAGKARRIKITLLITAAVLAVADLVIKALAEATLSNGATIELGLMNLKLLYNTGVAFSLGADLAPWMVIAATAAIILAMTWYAVSTAPTMSALSRAGAAMVVGGGVGNLVDRLDGRGVVDYLHSGWFPTFNLADVFVTVGVALYILGTLLGPKKQRKA
ncbi:signal peptidase II (plasmid) [Arthrobacter sp. FW305-123]|uniref:signal peptidase II n=2 Tax=Paenarthrobacter TaxID=1742992 RepID=UPI00248AAA2E|nr:signal peptidase II [Paenarthrobacter nitroguajacolicus]MDI2035956.1 Lipoprotein signal peptidase [Paenarthrobacter nitroguajacolicus]UKA52264.1 signal peptidase II [Arthrobacter sp. FW305-123]